MVDGYRSPSLWRLIIANIISASRRFQLNHPRGRTWTLWPRGKRPVPKRIVRIGNALDACARVCVCVCMRSKASARIIAAIPRIRNEIRVRLTRLGLCSHSEATTFRISSDLLCRGNDRCTAVIYHELRFAYRMIGENDRWGELDEWGKDCHFHSNLQRRRKESFPSGKVLEEFCFQKVI